MTISRVLLLLGIIHAIPGVWLSLQWWQGNTIMVFVLAQSFVVTALCLYGAWELRE